MGDQFSSGQTISHYRIISKIGQGGMGAVYKAEDTKLRRPVALKFLLREKFTLIDKQRFLREAQAAAALHHPNICTIYEVDEAEGEVFFAMAYLEGDTLATRIAAGPIEFDQALEIGIQLADAMHEAHSHGIVHRDIKGNNIVLTPKNQAIILDFGLAQISGTSKLTQTGATLGTAAYMSPEHARGQDVDRRGDLWSLAVVIYELATGQLPFRATQDLAMLFCIVNEPHLPASEVRPSLPPQFDAIMNLALAKDPDDRYQHASELAADLRSLKSLIGIETLVTGAMQPLLPPPFWTTRRKILGGAAGVIATAGMGWWYSAQPGAVPDGPAPGVAAPANSLHIAVMPLRYVGSTSGEDDEAFSDGLGEWLADRLAALQTANEGPIVVTPAEVREAGISGVSDAQRIFGAGRALTGSLQRDGKGWRVTLNLVDAGSVRQLQSAEVLLKSMDDPAAARELVARAAGLIGVEPGASSGGPAGFDAPPPAEAGEAFITGLGYLRRGRGTADLRSAMEHFEHALEAAPKHAHALSYLASTRLHRSASRPDSVEVRAALAEAQQAVELDPSLPAARVALAEALARLGRSEAALDQYRLALTFKTISIPTCKSVIYGLVSVGYPEEAEAALIEHRRVRPTDVRASLAIADYYAVRGRFDDAEREFRAALELTPENQTIPLRLAGLYRRIGQLDRAKAQVERSLAMRASAEGYAMLGSIEFPAKRYLQAATAYEMATEMSPSSPEYWGALGDCYRRSPASEGQSRAAFGRAIELVQRDLAAGGESAESRSQLALYVAKSGQPADGVRELAAMPAGAARNATVLLRSATVYELAGDRWRASRDLRAAIQAGASGIDIESEPDLAGVPR